MNKAATYRYMSVVTKWRHSNGNTYLEVIGWLLESIEQVQAILPPHTCRAKEDRGDQKQAKAEEAADPLSPAEPDTRNEVVKNDRKDDTAKGGTSGGKRHC